MLNRKRTKVLHYYTYPKDSGGPLTYIHTILNSSLQKDYEFGICFQNKAFSKIRIKDIINLKTEMNNFNPDIVHIHGLQGEGFIGLLIAKLSNAKSNIVTVHGLQQDSLSIGRTKKFIFKYFLEPLTLIFADAVYCVSEATEKRKIILKNTKNLKRYIHNPSPSIIRTSKDYLFKYKMGFSKKDIIVIIVGRVSVDKGMDILKKIIKMDSSLNIKYLVIGDGAYMDHMNLELKEEINSGKVKFMGQQNNVQKFYNISDIYLSVSLHENLSIAAIEACKFGLPCILSDVGGNNEIVDSGYNGYIVPSNDAYETLKKITHLSNDYSLRNHQGQNSILVADTKFSMKVFVKKINNLYSLNDSNKI